MDTQEKEDYFFGAAKTGDLSKVSRLIEEGVDIYAKDSYALQIASLHGHFEVVKLLLEQSCVSCAQVDSARADGDLALRWAAENGHEKVVELLLAKGSDVHAGDEEPLRLAVKNGHESLVKLLLRNGADLHIFGDWPLLLAAKSGSLGIVRLLVENGADAENNEAFLAAVAGNHLEIVRFLVENGADAENNEAFLAAVAGNHLEVVRFLMEKGAQIYFKREKSLLVAVENGYLEIVRLLTSKEDYYSRDEGNALDLALYFAALYGHFEIVQYLLSRGANPFEISESDLKEIAECGHEECFRCIQDSKIFHNILNSNLTPEEKSKTFFSLFKHGFEPLPFYEEDFDVIMAESTLLTLPEETISRFESSYPSFRGKSSQRKASLLRKKRKEILFPVTVLLSRLYYRPSGPGFFEAIGR